MLSPLIKFQGEFMKKKILGVAFCIIAAVMLFCVFAGCSRTASGGEMGTLELNKKYIHESYVQDKDGNYSYYIFTSADEGEHHYYYAGTGSNSRIYSYTIYYRNKTILDKGIIDDPNILITEAAEKLASKYFKGQRYYEIDPEDL